MFLLTPASSHADDHQPVILVLGDSISAGYGMSAQDGWVSLLQERLRQQGLTWQVVNASISGETTQGGLTRLPSLLRQHKPELVLLELGGNDGLRGLPLNLFKHNLKQMIMLSQQHNAKPVLLGIQLPPSYGRRYTQAFARTYPDLAEEYQIPVMPFILEGIGTDAEKMQADGIHPTSAAQPQLLNNIWPVISPLLKTKDS
ncbi:arylesterase [Oceanospirillum sp. D5]|uniref:Arylesterase n=2 Tax=Oceanospirillum sediminis TaxID=2760088 RepID=A0A839ILC3_9GAMM|nr:arylesterase [Oceanospirillum sediminis]